MFKIVFCSSLFLLMFSCQKDNQVVEPENARFPEKTTEIASKNKESVVTEKIKVYPSKYLAIENVLVNDHKIILPQQEFAKLYPKYDSIRTTLRECGHPLEWLDEKWMVKTYGEKDENVGTFARFDGKITRFSIKSFDFDSNNHLVIFDSGKAKGNTFLIISDQIMLDENTTVSDFKKLFPKIEMEETEDKDTVRFRLYIAENLDEAFLFYFKNGKLDYYTLWWLLC